MGRLGVDVTDEWRAKESELVAIFVDFLRRCGSGRRWPRPPSVRAWSEDPPYTRREYVCPVGDDLGRCDPYCVVGTRGQAGRRHHT